MKNQGPNQYLLLGALLCLAIVFAVIALNTTTQKDEAIVSKPNYNIKDVSYRVAVGKPEQALMQASIQDNAEKASSELTVYNQDLALVKDVRKMKLQKGMNLIEFKDISSMVDPTSVLFRDVTYPETAVIEQNFEYDLVNSSKLLEKYIDKQITVQVNEGDTPKEYSGKLLSGSQFGGLVLETREGIITLNGYSKIIYPQLPGGLLTKPTLVWKAYSEKDGERNTETIYLTGGLDWRADYVATVNTDDTKIDFSGWTTINNKSGTAYPDTSLKLVAGDVHRVQAASQGRAKYEYAMDEKVGASAPQFSNEQLFEYYMYTLERKTDIGNNETKQISLLSASNVPVKKEFVFDGAGGNYYYYYGGSDNKKVEVRLNLKNSKDKGLGIPLPKGIVRVYKKDSAGQLQFIGEDQIDHTKTEDEMDLFLGNAFDVTGERVQENVEEVSRNIRRESYRITLENQKDTEITVKVKEHAYNWTGWSIVKTSQDFEKKSSSEFHYYVKVPAKGKAEVSYTIEYRYY